MQYGQHLTESEERRYIFEGFSDQNASAEFREVNFIVVLKNAVPVEIFSGCRRSQEKNNSIK